MKRNKLLELTVGATVAVVLAWFTASAVDASEPDVTVNRVYDGDTFYADILGWPDIIGQDIGIRINGIDTPEIRGAGCLRESQLAVTAKHYVSTHLMSGNPVELRNMQRGKYFRIVADVYVGGVSMADLLIRQGLAVPYDGGTKTHDWCK